MDPLSPVSFIAVLEALNKLLLRAREVGLFRGLCIGKGEERVEVTHLFFANDTLLLCELKDVALGNIGDVLLLFEAM